MAGKLDVEIVTGERVVFREEGVDMVVAPGGAGVLGILPSTPLDHDPLPGRAEDQEGERRAVDSGLRGFMEVGDNKVLILADSAERAEEVDVERAEAARRRAEESIVGRQSTMDLEQAQASLRRANLQLRIGQRRGSRRTPVPGGEGFPGSGS